MQYIALEDQKKIKLIKTTKRNTLVYVNFLTSFKHQFSFISELNLSAFKEEISPYTKTELFMTII